MVSLLYLHDLERPHPSATGYRRDVEAARTNRQRTARTALRVGLVLFVVAWLADWGDLQSRVSIWLPFAIALGLELHFFLGAWRREASRTARSDRGPQEMDLERYGFADEADELLLVRRGGEELWIPYSGETGEDLDELIAEAQEEPEPEPRPRPSTRTGRRPVRQLLLGLGVIAALAGVAWVVERGGWDGLDADTRAAAVDRFSAEASRIARHPVTIRCDESGDYVGAVQHADGVAAVGGRLAYLTPERCYDLYRLAFEDDVTFSQTARAIAVLAHEAWHLRGVRDEGATECYALQSGVELGQRLGLSEGTARRMMRQQLAENALRGGISEYLVPADCRDGGALDLDPRSSRFP
jgi:hypothetical protein